MLKPICGLDLLMHWYGSIDAYGRTTEGHKLRINLSLKHGILIYVWRDRAKLFPMQWKITK